MNGTFRIGTLNLNLFGQTAWIGGRPTPLWLQDEARADSLAKILGNIGPHFLALTGVWDLSLALKIRDSLQNRYPYTVSGPFRPGLEPAVESLLGGYPQLPTVLDNAAALARCLARGMVEEDPIVSQARLLFGGQILFGAGLLFLSRHPIVAWDFYDFTDRGGLEVFSEKGFLRVVVQPENAQPLTIIQTHLQMGESGEAARIREGQLRQIRTVASRAEMPAVIAGDFNIPAETMRDDGSLVQTAGYLRMLDILKFRDAYRACHPLSETHGESSHAGGRPLAGFTHHDDNPFAQQLGLGGKGRKRSSFILHGEPLRTICASVWPEVMRDRHPGPLTDHHWLEATLVATPA